jgi:hypothetical protein
LATKETVTVNGEPAQLPGAVGVTKYVAVVAKGVVLFSRPLMSVEAVLETPPLNPVPVGANQEYLVLKGTTSTPSVGVIEKGDPPQAIIVGCVAKMGMGLINTVNVKSAPGPQAVVEGVTI